MAGVLAYCDMATLYLRNVPDDVMRRLKRLAARERMLPTVLLSLTVL